MSSKFYAKSLQDPENPYLWCADDSVARLFKGHCEAVAELLGVPSGVGDLTEGKCAVDVPVFTAFCAEAMTRYSTTDEGVLRSLTVGFLATALVVLHRGGHPVPAPATEQQRLAWTVLRDQHAELMSR